MIDTVKLALEINPDVFSKILSANNSGNARINDNRNYIKVAINNNEKNIGYHPKLTMYKRTTPISTTYVAYVEFSAPKLLIGNNVEELCDENFSEVITQLQIKLKSLCGHDFLEDSIRKAKVVVWHPSKNIIFRDFTSCLTVLSSIAKLDVSKQFDMQARSYRVGHSLQLHTNSLDICLYDKIAELQQASKSPKRSIEVGATKQSELLQRLQIERPIDILRYEVRLSNRRMVVKTFSKLVVTCDFESLFSSKLSQQVLVNYWAQLTRGLDILALDSKQPFEIFQNYLLNNPDSSVNSALQATAGLMIVSQMGYRTLEQQITKKSSAQKWYRLKPDLYPLPVRRHKTFEHITLVLNDFSPVRFPP